jgi:hypothetical protein
LELGLSEVSACCVVVFLSYLIISASNPFACSFLPSSNTGCLHIDHFQWQDESLVVYFAHQKNDQKGKHATFFHLLFCNAFNKYVCHVFALALWLASNEEMTMVGGPLFPGFNQQLWCNKLFWSFLNEHADLLLSFGCDPDLLGVHYFRKGAGSFESKA